MRSRSLLLAVVSLVTLGVTGSRLNAQATATVCKDGTTSAAAGKGACSGHGDVDANATAAAKKTEQRAQKAQRAEQKAEQKADKKADAAAKSNARSPVLTAR